MPELGQVCSCSSRLESSLDRGALPCDARAAAGRARLLPRRLAGGERAGHRRRHLGVGAALLQRRQQPRRRHRLRRLRAGGRARTRPAWSSTPSGQTAPRPWRACSSTWAAAASSAPTAPSCRQPTCSRASTDFRLPVRERYAGVRGLAARRPARRPGRLHDVVRGAAPDVLAALRPPPALPASAGCSGPPSTATSATRCSARSTRRPTGAAATGDRGRACGLRRRRARGVLHRARAPHRLALLPHARRARGARRQVLGQAARLPGLDGPGPRGGQDQRLDAHDPRVLRLRALLGRVSRLRRRRPGPHAHVWGMHHRYPTNSPAHRRRGARQPRRRPPVQGLQRAAHAQRRAGRRRLHGALPRRVRLRARRRRRWGRAARLRGRLHLRPQGAHRHRVRRLSGRLHAPRARPRAPRRPRRSSRRSPASTSTAMDDERRRLFELLSLQLRAAHADRARTSSRSSSRAPADGGGGRAAARARRVGFRENMDIKFLRPHELVVSVDTGPGGVQAVANGSEAKIADSMLRVLHDQGVLKDAGHDLRFNMRPGGNPGRGEFGGVVEAFLTPAAASSTCGTVSAMRWRSTTRRAQDRPLGDSRVARAESTVDGGVARRRRGAPSPRMSRRDAAEPPGAARRRAAAPRPRRRAAPGRGGSRRDVLARLARHHRRRLPPSRREGAAGVRGAGRRALAPSPCACSPSCASASTFADLGGKALSSGRVPYRRRARRRPARPRAASTACSTPCRRCTRRCTAPAARQPRFGGVRGRRSPAALGPPDRSPPATTCCRRTTPPATCS